MSDPRAHRLTTPEQQKALYDATRAQLATYECHREVTAVRIKAIKYGYCGLRDRNTTLLIPEDPRLEPIEVSKEFVAQFDPHAPCYFVVLEGAESCMEVGAFDRSFTLTEDAKPQDLSALLPRGPDEDVAAAIDGERVG